jgi:8-oxo-dGTP pyrophosphatase MutT (NUDIX family)
MTINLPHDQIVSVRSVSVVLETGPHPFIAGNEDAIARNWERATADNPALFDGRMALLSELKLAGEDLVGRCHIVPYSAFMYWRTLRPVDGIIHAYAHALLVSSDNALVLIRMGATSVNAGLVYCAAGSFEPEDFRDGLADIEANMRREVWEETGLDITDWEHEHAYQILAKVTGTVLFRRYFSDRTADELAESIRAHVALESEPEIEGPVIVRTAEDKPDRLAAQMPALIDWHFATSRGG